MGIPHSIPSPLRKDQEPQNRLLTQSQIVPPKLTILYTTLLQCTEGISQNPLNSCRTQILVGTAYNTRSSQWAIVHSQSTYRFRVRRYIRFRKIFKENGHTQDQKT